MLGGSPDEATKNRIGYLPEERGLYRKITMLESLVYLASLKGIGAQLARSRAEELGIVYFVLGYLLFAVLMAGVGSIATTAREGQQLSAMFTMFGVIPFILAPFIMENPSHIVTQILTLFPITAPITVMIKLGLADIPTWELVLSITLLVASIVGALLLAAKECRVTTDTFGLLHWLRGDLIFAKLA